MPSPAGEETIEVDLKTPWKAALLAFLIPGAGHIYQGRTGKGILFAVCILGTFFYGLYLGEGRVVYASTTNPVGNPGKFIERWQYACQAAVGLPALPAYMQAWRVESGEKPLFGDNFQRPPYTPQDIATIYRSEDEILEARTDHLTTNLLTKNPDGTDQIVYHANEGSKWQHDHAFYFELGTIYTVIAGLLNVLAIYDAHSGPVMASEDDDKSNKDDENKAQGHGKS